MDPQYLQTLRYKLQKRFRRLNSIRSPFYHYATVCFWQFLTSHPAFVGIIDDLLAREPSAPEEAQKILRDRQALAAGSEIQAAAIGACVIRACVTSEARMPELDVAAVYGREQHHDDTLRRFTEVFAEPLYEYVDEQLDERGAILAVLRNYKHKVEWFQRAKLYESWKTDTQRGEKTLALHLYEYLHDQGIRFFIEPSSVSGEADLVGAQQSDEPLIADAKIFNPDKRKRIDYLAKGFKQLYTYCADYNENVGYLIVFNTSDTELRLLLEGETHGTPYAVLNNKTIFFIVIDIFLHAGSASKRGTVHAHELKLSKLVATVEEGMTKEKPSHRLP